MVESVEGLGEAPFRRKGFPIEGESPKEAGLGGSTAHGPQRRKATGKGLSPAVPTTVLCQAYYLIICICAVNNTLPGLLTGQWSILKRMKHYLNL